MKSKSPYPISSPRPLLGSEFSNPKSKIRNEGINQIKSSSLPLSSLPFFFNFSSLLFFSIPFIVFDSPPSSPAPYLPFYIYIPVYMCVCTKYTTLRIRIRIRCVFDAYKPNTNANMNMNTNALFVEILVFRACLRDNSSHVCFSFFEKKIGRACWRAGWLCIH